MLNPVSFTWLVIQPDLTPENALAYSKTVDKLVFCADLTGLSVDSRLLARFENELIKIAESLGYLN
jgi:hypothetical protein